MRFVAGRGAVAERLQRGGAVAEMLAAAWRIAIGKKLLPGRAIGKKLLAGAPWRRDWPGRRCCTIEKQLPAEKSQGTIEKKSGRT